MALGDEAALKAVTIPATGFEWLLRGDHVPPAQAEEFRKAVVDRLRRRRQFLAGDEVNAAWNSGAPIKIAPEQVTDDRAVLTMQGGPIPTNLHRVMGAWRVDPRPIIAGRRAADAARRRAEEAKKKARP